MHYYKETENESIVGYFSNTISVNDARFEEITKEEYDNAMEEMKAKAELEIELAEQSKDARIAELEAENAALLYQVLTGEELTDV